MIGRLAGGTILAAARLALRLWPLWLFVIAWSGAHWLWQQHLLTYGAAPGRPLPPGYAFAWHAWPAATLAGPALLGLAAVALHRAGLATRLSAVAGLAGVLLAIALTVWPEWQRLAPYAGRVTPTALFGAVNTDVLWAVLLGVAAFAGGASWLRQPLGATAARSLAGGRAPLVRARSDNHGHADWLSMREARQLFPGPDPAFGGIVVGEAYRVDEDRGARGRPFDPADRRSWGSGGRAPLLVDPCRTGPTHALAFAGSGGFKTVSLAVPTLLTWTGSAVVLDPSREVGPMLAKYRASHLKHGVVTLDPTRAGGDALDVLDWIDTASPLAEGHVEAVVGWVCGEPPRQRVGAATGSGEFFRDSGRALVACLLADLLWDPTLPRGERTLRELRRRVAEGEKELRERLGRVHGNSASRMAKELAGSLKDLVPETFSGIYANAGQATRWLSVPAYADLVSGGPEGRYAPARKTAEITGGELTVFVQVPLETLAATPSLARVLVGALLNAAYRADGAVEGRILFLLDEAARLGPMSLLETARDAGRKYRITLFLLYQSLGQLREQWGEAGRQAWSDGTSWRLYAAVQDPETAREVSALCGEHGVVATSEGDTHGTQGRLGLGMAGAASASSGRSENRSELRRALIKPDELLQDTRSDEAFVFARGAKPLRCGRAIWFRRPEWEGLLGENRFHGGTPAPVAPPWRRVLGTLGLQLGRTG